MTDKTSTDADAAATSANERRNALVDAYNDGVSDVAAAQQQRSPRTHDQSVLLRLTVIAWSAGILAALAFLGFIVGIALYSSEMNDLVNAIRNHP